jgi:phosphate transport system permease protein
VKAKAKAKAEGRPAPQFKAQSYVYSAGGIWPCIVGTVLLVVGSMTIALALGVCSGDLTSMNTRSDGPAVRFIRLAILNLAGVPSIVFGLFGFGMFVIFLDWNVSLLAGWFTLAFMVLPVVITASGRVAQGRAEGFPRRLPRARRDQVADHPEKRAALRAAGHPDLVHPRDRARGGRDRPDHVHRGLRGARQAAVGGRQAERLLLPGRDGAALPHLRRVSSKIPQNEYTSRVQYGTAFVFLGIVALIATTSILLRNRLRNRYQW